MCTTRAHKATSSKQCLPNTHKHTCSFARYLILILMATNLDTTLKFYKIFCARSRRGREIEWELQKRCITWQLQRTHFDDDAQPIFRRFPPPHFGVVLPFLLYSPPFLLDIGTHEAYDNAIWMRCQFNGEKELCIHKRRRKRKRNRHHHKQQQRCSDNNGKRCKTKHKYAVILKEVSRDSVSIYRESINKFHLEIRFSPISRRFFGWQHTIANTKLLR